MAHTLFTQAIWPVARDPHTMLIALGNEAGARKLRLLLVAVVRRIWSQCNESERAALETLELFADGKATLPDMERCRSHLAAAGSKYMGAFDRVIQFAVDIERAPTMNTRKAIMSVIDTAIIVPGHFSMQRLHGTDREDLRRELDRLAVELVRDIFDNPYEPVTIDPAWLHWNGGRVPTLAQALYNDRRFDDLPMLADALEEAGCQSEHVLLHCRQPEDHYRGCFLVDLILEKREPCVSSGI